MNSLLFAKTVSIFGLAIYMTIAVINNTLDRGTNEHFLNQMFSMNMLKEDPYIAKGITSRAISNEKFSQSALNVIIIIQAIICISLWTSGIFFSFSFLFNKNLVLAVNITTYSLSIFMALWFCFWCGGFWFGYWIKTPQIQEVHMKLIILSILEIIFINFN